MRTMWNAWRSLDIWGKGLMGLGGLIFLFGFFVISFEAVHYTETTEFCSSCHAVMEPEIVPHSLSAHRNVDCADCHIGEGVKSMLYYKITATRYLWTLPTQLYERPLPSARGTMRTTEEICESCHSPEFLHPAKLIVRDSYASDEANTLTRLALPMKINDGGDELTARSTGPHWHLENKVSFVATDEFRQTIPWVQIEKDGQVIEYIDSEADPTSWEGEEILTLDCIDCHSREGHAVQMPSRAIDAAISRGDIPADLPAIKAQSVTLLNERYESDEVGLTAIETTIRDFYQAEHPTIASSRASDIDQTIGVLQTLFDQTQFPHMNVYWDTYPENTGHKDFPGCFRCHDGNHLSESGEAISASCNLCHAIPQVMEMNDAEAHLAVQLAGISIDEAPESHQSSLWLAEHRFRFDITCNDCHTVADPGGSSNISTCSNSGCHASEWDYLNIDSPAVLAQVVPERRQDDRRLPRIPHPLVEAMDCQNCHGLEKAFSFPDDHADYTPAECTDCHQLTEEAANDSPGMLSTSEPIAPTELNIPLIPHELAGNEACLACHAVDSNIQPAPPTHRTFTIEQCGDCHLLSPQPLPLQSATATPAPEATATIEPTVSPTDTPAAETTAIPAEPDTDEEATKLPITSHTVAGNETCNVCHAVDSDIAPAPADHLGYTDDLCLACHQEE